MKIIYGHGLRNEGAAQPYTYPKKSSHGPAGCQCGVLSEPLPSDNKRKAWHRKHKEHVADALTKIDTTELEKEARRVNSLYSGMPFDKQAPLIKAIRRATAMYELLRDIDPNHPAFGAGFISREDF